MVHRLMSISLLYLQASYRRALDLDRRFPNLPKYEDGFLVELDCVSYNAC